jgi:hypothetical protein
LLIVMADADGLPAVDDLAERSGWRRMGVLPRKTTQMFEVIWQSPDESSVIRFIRDHLVDVEFMVFQGPQARALRELVAAALPIFDFASCLEMAHDDDPDERALALPFLAVLSPGVCDAELLELFWRLSGDEHDKVRLALLQALSRIAWPELRPVARKMAQEDPVERFRRRAAWLAHCLDKALPEHG